MDEKFGISTKKSMLGELKEQFQNAPDFVVTNYKGLDASEIEQLRVALHGVSSRYYIVKNSIAKRALDELEIADVKEFIKGEVGIGFTGDILKASKALAGFAKEHKSFKLTCAVLDGKREGSDRIQYLATVPSKEALLGLAVTYMKSPITGFVGVLSGVLRKLVGVMNAIKEKKEK